VQIFRAKKTAHLTTPYAITYKSLFFYNNIIKKMLFPTDLQVGLQKKLQKALFFVFAILG
jgi:hypothetical protein